MTINKVLQLIRAHPIIVAVIVVAIPATVVAISLNQPPPKKPVYQWQIESERMRKQIDQFSDLAQPSKKP